MGGSDLAIPRFAQLHKLKFAGSRKRPKNVIHTKKYLCTDDTDDVKWYQGTTHLLWSVKNYLDLQQMLLS